jgi:hypothetical protein
MIVKYDHKTFTVQAPGVRVVNIGVQKTFSKLPSTNIRAGEQGSRGAEEQESRGAREQGSRGAGEQGTVIIKVNMTFMPFRCSYGIMSVRLM